MNTDKTISIAPNQLAPKNRIRVHPCSSVAKNKPAFTIVEALISALLLAIGAVVVFGITQHCQRNSIRCIQYETAYQILDECFEQALLTGPTALQQPETSPPTQITRSNTNYNCTYDVAAAQQDNLYEITITIDWQYKQNAHQITANTLIYEQ